MVLGAGNNFIAVRNGFPRTRLFHLVSTSYSSAAVCGLSLYLRMGLINPSSSMFTNRALPTPVILFGAEPFVLIGLVARSWRQRKSSFVQATGYSLHAAAGAKALAVRFCGNMQHSDTLCAILCLIQK